MKLATLRDGTTDGCLMVVSDDFSRTIAARIVPTLQSALDRWAEVAPQLTDLARELNRNPAIGQDLDIRLMDAPLPRAWQWLDASAFPSHGDLMQKAFNLAPIVTNKPLMYQGMSHRFLGPYDDIPFPDEADGIDLEAEFGVITDFVPMGTSAEAAMSHIKLCVIINDWSLRTIAPVEMKTGFGWVQAKPACSLGPLAITPDALGECWQNGRILATMSVHVNGNILGRVPGDHMAFGFHELIAHAALTRDLCAGTLIGSGTVSSPQFDTLGSCCLAEKRAIEMIRKGKPETPFLRYADRVQIEAHTARSPTIFGALDQTVVKAGAG